MNKELILIIDAVVNEKNVNREIIFQAIETAIETVAKRRLEKDSFNFDIRVEMDRNSGLYKIYRCWTIVQEDEFINEYTEKNFTLYSKENPDVSIGEIIKQEINSVNLGRIAANIAKQVIIKKVRDAETEQMISTYQKKVGNILHGIEKES